MRKFILTLLSCLIFGSSAMASWDNPYNSLFEVGIGYRQGKFKWKIGGNGVLFNSESDCFPTKFQSTLAWKSLNIFQVEAKAVYAFNDLFYMRGYAGYGWITKGKNRDSDFFMFNPEETTSSISFPSNAEFGRSEARTKGSVRDLTLGFGYILKLNFCGCCEDLHIFLNPIAGYSWHAQHLRDRHLHQIFPKKTCDSSHIHGLDSTYHARWHGPWLGVDFGYQSWAKWAIFISYEFHWARYRAHANWNLREDLSDGFHHDSRRAYGQVVKGGIRGPFCNCWSIGVSVGYENWYAKKGQCKVLRFEDDGRRADINLERSIAFDAAQKCYIKQPLKKAAWRSAQITLDIGAFF